MKRILSLVTAGFVGALMALFIFQKVNQAEPQVVNQSPQFIRTAGSSPTIGFDFIKAAEIATPTVVHISVEQSPQFVGKQNDRYGFFEDFFGYRNMPQSGAGSGVIISEDGYIVTNNHVVENGDRIMVELGDQSYAAKKIGVDPSTDIALLKVEANGLDYVEFADSDEVKVGEWVVAVGNPFSYLTSTVTAGIVSAKGRDIDILNKTGSKRDDRSIEEFIQTDAAINPGNSGGALVNTDGKLVGINTAIATPTGVFAGYSFAIPSNLVKRIVNDIKQYGDIERGRLGIEGRSINEELKAEVDIVLAVDKGFYVANVFQGSGAQFAGVLPGDIIIGANDKEIESYEDLIDIVSYAKVGDKINLTVLRKNKEKRIPVTLR